MRECTDRALQPVHKRVISITTYATGDDSVMVEGNLTDNRLVETCSITTGEKLTPGVIHDLDIRLSIEGPSLRVADVDVDVGIVPRDECRQMKDFLMPLIGRTIAPGFTRWVKETLGGTRGCTHLNALLIAMAPAVLQGFWNARTARCSDVRQAGKGMALSYLIDTCRVWRSDGPLASKLRSFLHMKDPRG